MNILTWNLCHGRAAAVWAVLQKNLSADLVFLQESDRPEWVGDVDWEPNPHRKRGSATLVKSGKIRRIPVPGYEGWVTGGEWLGSGWASDGRPLYTFSIHAPSGNPRHPRKSYVHEVKGILAAVG